MPPISLFIAVSEGARPPGEALRSAFTLWAILALLGVILVTAFALVLAGRRRRRMRATARKRAGPPIKDAWVEAGRRAKPEDFDGPRPPEPRGPEESRS